MSKYISLSFYVYFSVVLPLPTAVSICKVGDCGLQIYQTKMKLKRATALGFTIITPILNIHCWTKSRSRGSSFEVKVVFLYFYEPHFKIFSSWKNLYNIEFKFLKFSIISLLFELTLENSHSILYPFSLFLNILQYSLKALEMSFLSWYN